MTSLPHFFHCELTIVSEISGALDMNSWSCLRHFLPVFSCHLVKILFLFLCFLCLWNAVWCSLVLLSVVIKKKMKRNGFAKVINVFRTVKRAYMGEGNISWVDKLCFTGHRWTLGHSGQVCLFPSPSKECHIIPGNVIEGVIVNLW